MAILLFDGFDNLDVDAAAYPNGKWDSASGFTWGASSGRRGGGTVLLNDYTDHLTKLVSNKQTLILGAAVKHLGDISDNQDLFTFEEGGTVQLSLRHSGWDGTSYINAYRNGTLLGTTATKVVGADTWYYYEMKVYIHSTAGTVEIRLNGTTVLSLTGINTQATANAYADTVRYKGHNTDVYYDDVYLLDDTGSANNDFLGDVKVVTIYPDADGTYTDFTPSTGTDHYALVDEAAANTTDYNDGAAVNDMDSYGITAPSDLGTILGIQVNSYAQNPDVGTRKMKNFIRSSAADYLASTENTLSGVWTLFADIWETDPADSNAWTKTKLDAAEFGVKVTV